MEMSMVFLIAGCLIQGVLCELDGFEINLPPKVEALQGSCVFISCGFNIDPKYNNDLTDSAKRLWRKGTDKAVVVFDSSSPDTGLFKGEMFGTATQNNCTTRFDNVGQEHNGRYYFRLEADGGLQYNYNMKVEIAVTDGPKSTSVSVLSPTGFVVEGDSVTLSCSSDSNPVANYIWIREGDLKPVQTGPNLTINNIDLTHNGQYYCIVQNKYGTQNTSVLLDVQSSISQQTYFCLRPAHD